MSPKYTFSCVLRILGLHLSRSIGHLTGAFKTTSGAPNVSCNAIECLNEQLCLLSRPVGSRNGKVSGAGRK
ncbi:hypothetical protein F5Y15DRAFT_374812 [Xylariaceae sp. FL0016]|nr:hypothetical protein F5Y15DRAFT_374812 [Xylariaceae sp. FL0016]